MDIMTKLLQTQDHAMAAQARASVVAANLRLKPKKCQLLRESVIYLGHVICTGDILPDPAKTKQVENNPHPSQDSIQ